VANAVSRLRLVLRVLGAGLVVAGLIYAVGPFVLPDLFREEPFVANSVVKVTVLGLMCLYAAGDLGRRFALVWLVIAAHVVSVTAMLLALAFGDTDRTVELLGGEPTIATVLWSAIALDAVITLAVAVLAVTARRHVQPSEPAPADGAPLTNADRVFRGLMVAFGALFMLAAAAYGLGALLDDTRGFFVELPFVTNSVVKDTAMALMALYVARDVRRNLALAGPLVAAHFVLLVVVLAYLAFADLGDPGSIFGWDPSLTDILWGTIALNGAIGVGLLLAYRWTWRSRERLDFLGPAQLRALTATADVLIEGEAETVSPEQVARNVDDYLKDVKAQRSWVYRVSLLGLQFGPLATALPPLSECGRDRRRNFLERSFWHPPPWPPILRNGTRAAVRVGQQLSFAGYYNDPATWPSIGYEPFEQRERFKDLDLTEPGEHPLTVETDVDGDVLETEVCIVGSGAGGATLAYELAKAGRDVLILERGRYVQPREFTHNEVEMIGALYADGVMQQTTDFKFTVLQGSCVGGSTTVNNAVCFRPPDHVLDHWNDDLGAAIDRDALGESLDAVEDFLSVGPQDDAVLNPSGAAYATAAAGRPLEVGPVRANIDRCVGCGYCNIGCKWGRKLSMLDVTLPEAQRAGRVRILADCEVERVRSLSGKPRRVADLRAWLKGPGRRITVKADRYVLAAGAVGSSYLLLKSGAGRGLPVGRRLCFNMGAPLTAELPQTVDAYDGLQISHYGLPEPWRGYVFETWFNPPVAQALNMPGWFGDHFHNMSRYDHMMAVGVLVGTEASARVKKAALGGPDIEFTPGAGDLQKLAAGLRELGEILFDAGATRVMLNTARGDEIDDRSDLDRIQQIVTEPGAMTLGTGHPQGGNALGAVLDDRFRVRGYEDLYVCDASVFPSSLTVNPQLTVMGLAHYAATRMT
jgi:choline dehydrogenase-like flavoprotein